MEQTWLGPGMVGDPRLQHPVTRFPQTLLSVQVKVIRAKLGAVWMTALPPPPLEQGLVPVLFSIAHLGFPPNPRHANVQDNKNTSPAEQCLVSPSLDLGSN